jgi:hypothetical protein
MYYVWYFLVLNFYNASDVKIYEATGSLARFENKNIFFCF